MSDINAINDNLKETSFILGASYNSQQYSSETPDENALIVAESSTYTDITVSKSGDSTTVETPNSGTNAAVVVIGPANAAIIKESTIISECNNSQGVYCYNYGDVTIEDTTITTAGNNNAAIVSNSYGNIDIIGGSILTSGEDSPAIYAGDHSGIINVQSDISVMSDNVMASDYDNYSITLENASIYGSSALGSFSKSGEINIKDSSISSFSGFNFVNEDSGEDRSNFIVYLIGNSIDINNTLFNLSNTDFYISIKGNEEFALNNTLASISNGSKGTIAIREQELSGEVIIDESSAIRMTISDNSNYTGAIIKPEEANIEGNKIRMNLSRSSWTLSEDTFLTELIVDDVSTINLNGYTLTVNDISSDYQVGYIVNYKSIDGTIHQTNLVIIKINEDGTYNLYDTDDYVTYNNVYTSEITFTARILDDIDALLADIDERAKTSQTTEGLEDGITVVVNGTSDTNGILIDSGDIEHTDITVIKSGGTGVENPTLLNTISNAAILVNNGAKFTYHSSSITTNANYSAGLVVSDENSEFITTNIEVTTNQDNSVGIIAADQGTFTGTGLTVATSGQNSHGVYVDNAVLILNNTTIDAQGSAAIGVVVRSISEDVILNGVNISSTDYALYITDTSSVVIQNSILNNGIFVEEESYVEIDHSTINTDEIEAYNVTGSGTINNANNTITSTNSHAIIIENADTATLTLTNDNITNTGNYSSIYIHNSSADVIIDNTIFNTEDIMLHVDGSVVNLTLAGDVVGDIVTDEDCILNVTISGNYTGVINVSGISGEVNVTITDTGTWTLSTGQDSYVYSLTIEDSDNTRVIYNGTSRLFVNDESFVNRNDVPIDIDSGYSTKLYPTQRTLKVCKSEELPDKPDRDKNYMYLVYDKMELHIYQSRYSDPFCIVEVLPANKAQMTDKMVYITTDGYIYCYMNYKAYQLGTVENFDSDQLEILRKCGTTYFLNAESRYIDKQKRTIQLPFQNGNYQLNLSIFEDVMIDENTVIRFNPETEQFYIAGKEYQFDNRLNNIHAYSGRTSNTVKNKIDKHVFRSDVRISENENNSIQALKNGLYVSTFDLAKLDDYDRMILAFANYKSIIDIYISELREIVGEATESVSPAQIAAKITEALNAYEPTIQTMFDQYSGLSDRLATVEDTVTNGFSTAMEAAKDEIKNYINESNTAWEEVPESGYEPEYSDDQLAIRALALSEIRSQFVSLRETTDPEEERIGTEGIIYDVGYARSGLSEDETSVQEYILNELTSLFYSIDSWLMFESYDDLPETGESWYRYFVINTEDEENPVYQEYMWIDTSYEYDEETEETIEIPGHYELVYNYQPEEAEP